MVSKPDFANNPACRLINPSKTVIGVISKHLLDDINSKIVQATQVNLWRITINVIKWFNAILDKCQYTFTTFHVCEFYPSISENLLTKALDYASRFTKFTQQDHITIHSKRSLLYHQNSPWTKKKSDSMFDVTMGSYDGAETCELIGVYMLSLIATQFRYEVGLYRRARRRRARSM